jgi:hypothetical protein
MCNVYVCVCLSLNLQPLSEQCHMHQQCCYITVHTICAAVQTRLTSSIMLCSLCSVSRQRQQVSLHETTLHTESIESSASSDPHALNSHCITTPNSAMQTYLIRACCATFCGQTRTRTSWGGERTIGVYRSLLERM